MMIRVDLGFYGLWLAEAFRAGGADSAAASGMSVESFSKSSGAVDW